MSRGIARVAVLGAGTMGAAIAAHCANAGLLVDLLDLAPDQPTPQEAAAGLTAAGRAVRDRVVTAGFERMRQARPAALYTPALAAQIRLGNFADDFARLAEADWIVEAIVERLEPKRELLARIEAARRAGCIVSSNTSGIPLHQIAAGRSAELRANFLGTHFFNPPRYLPLLELIPTADTDPAVPARLRAFAERTLGKRVVVCKDTPGFIANRIGTFSGMTGMRAALAGGFGIAEVDALTGPLIGRPKTASFRLADLAGIDIMAGVAANLHAALPDDESREQLRPLPVLERLVAAGRLGNKSGGGFYRRVQAPGGKPEFHIVDLETLEYRPPAAPDLPLAARVGGISDLGERLRAILARADAGDRQAGLLEATLLPTLAYAARRVPEISDDIVSIDEAMRWGFGQQLGPFQTWDALGVAETAARMQRLGIGVAPWVTAMLEGGHTSFYRSERGRVEAYSPLRRRYEPLPQDPDVIDLAALKAAGGPVAGNGAATLVDLGEGVLCCEFHSKANSIGRDTMLLLGRALDMLAAEGRWRAMVIGNQGDYFSAGVNLREVGAAAQGGDLEQLAAYLREGQALVQRLRFSPKPVVAAPFGQTLGLGLEVCLACAGVCAEGEAYLGLVEAGVGLIPAGGGCKELVRRLVSPPLRVAGADATPFLRRVLETVLQARVSGSAAEARELGYLAEGDRIVLGRHRLLAEARRMALDLAEARYRPPLPGPSCYAAGQGALAALVVGLHQFRRGGYLSDYDAEIGRTLAGVLCGGDLSAPQWVPEGYLLDLERAGILHLLQQPQTQQRIAHLLQTGERLRN